MNYGPAGAGGQWPHRHAIAAFLRHKSKDAPTVREVAIHEAGHVVVGHTLGVAYKTVSARPAVDARAGTGWWGENRYHDSYTECFSHGEVLCSSLGGRAADERQGRFDPLYFDPGNDEGAALLHAGEVSEWSADAMSRALYVASRFAARTVESRWSDILRLADELAKRDLDSDDIERILGPLPGQTIERTERWDPRKGREVGSECFYKSALALLWGRPYAVGHVTLAGRPALLWLNTASELMVCNHRGVEAVLRLAS